MIQDIILAAFLREKQFFAEYSALLDDDYFEDSSHKIPCNVYIDYINQYRQMPSDTEMYSSLDAYCIKYGIDAKIKQTAIETLMRCYKLSFNVDYARDNFLKFATRNKMTKAIIDSAKLLKTKGDQMTDNDYETINKSISEAVEIKARDTQGILFADVADDPKTFIQQMNKFDKKLIVPTGLPTLDQGHIAGGMLPGEFGVLVAPPGKGKSTLLVNFGAHAVVKGQDVVHIFVGDNSEADAVLRYCARLTGATMAQVMLNAQVYLDAWNMLKQNFKLGNLMIGAYPIDGPTMGDLRSFVTRNMIRKGINPRLIIIDYIDNCRWDRSLGSYGGVGALYREAKNMAEELNVAVWSASQPKVDTWDSDRIGLGSLSESSMKQHIVDAIGTMSQVGDGLFDLYIAKLRRGRADYVIPLQLSYEKMMVKESAVNHRPPTGGGQSNQTVTPPTTPSIVVPGGAPQVPGMPQTGGFGSGGSAPVPPPPPTSPAGVPVYKP